MDHWDVKAEVQRHRAAMHARQRRVALLTAQVRQAEADRDQAVAAFVKLGEEHEEARRQASHRSIGRELGVTHRAVGGMVERARTRGGSPPAPAVPLVPVLGAEQARAYVESGALGDLARVIVAYSPGDVLLECGLDPATLIHGPDVDVPTLLLYGTNGTVIGVEECLAGYQGTGPTNSLRLLKKLGVADTVAREVYYHRFIELSPQQVIRASAEGLHDVGGGLQLSADGRHFVVRVRGERPYHKGDWTLRDTVTAWRTEVMDHPDRYPWAAGTRRARVYLDRDAAAPLQEPKSPYWTGAPASYSVIIEQGRLQLWVSAIYPYNFADLISTEQLSVLDAADLRPEGIEPRTWLDRFLPHRRERPDFLIISDDRQDLVHPPEGTQ
ncbi:hypothetical protein ACIG3E_33260 [Streptomyces sp. NPDC053474]|uniref:hypothetical protein n=1 Tax=Streptomyces sp. NPDC053474 TaxID=3365704 RepID=UPI0037D50986